MKSVRCLNKNYKETYHVIRKQLKNYKKIIFCKCRQLNIKVTGNAKKKMCK